MNNRTLFILLLALLPLGILTGASLWDFFAVPPRSAPEDRELIAEVNSGKLDRESGRKLAENLEVGLEEVHLILPLGLPGNYSFENRESSNKDREDLNENQDSNNQIASKKSEFLNHMTEFGKYHEQLFYIQRWNSVLCSFLEELRPLRKITPKALSDAEEMNEENKKVSKAALKSLDMAKTELSKESEEFNQSLEIFSKAFPNAPLAKDSDEITTHLNEMVELAMGRVKRAQEMHQLKKDFMKAQKLFVAGEFKECNDICREILTSKIADDAFLKKVQKVHYMARSTRAVEEIDEIEKTEILPRYRLKRLKDLADDVKTAAGGRLDEESIESLGKDFLEKLNDVVSVNVEENYKDEILGAIVKLEENPPKSFVDVLSEAGEIADKIQDMDSELKEIIGTTQTLSSVTEFRERIQVLLKTLLEEKLPLDVSANDKIQEAILTNGKTVTGYFDPVEQNGSTIGYKIYDSYEDFKNPTGSKGMTPMKEFRKEPGLSRESLCVERYMMARKHFLMDFENKEDWKDFLKECESIQKELKDWEDETGLKVSFTLKDPIAIAKLTLKEENWATFKKIFSVSPNGANTKKKR